VPVLYYLLILSAARCAVLPLRERKFAPELSTRLIEEALPYSLSAETTFELGPDGSLCRICLPLGPSDAGEAAA
jgi:hypothetical protein